MNLTWDLPETWASSDDGKSQATVDQAPSTFLKIGTADSVETGQDNSSRLRIKKNQLNHTT